MLRKGNGEKSFHLLNYTLLALLVLVTVMPFWIAVVGAFSDGSDYIKGGVYFWPRKFSLANFVVVFQEKEIYRSFFNIIAKTLLSTALSLFFTSMTAYYYLVLNSLNLINNFMVYIIPSMLNLWNMIIILSSFREISEAVLESARMDGAGEFTIFLRLVLPLSKPVLAAIALFLAVGAWNSYFDALMFTSSSKLQTIQLYLYRSLTKAAKTQEILQRAGTYLGQDAKRLSPLTVRYATMVVASAPIIAVYPWLQKYFVKGVMIGSLK